MESMFKVGDLVRILPRKDASFHYPFGFTTYMCSCVGELHFINGVSKMSPMVLEESKKRKNWNGDPFCYSLQDFNDYSWHSSMLKIAKKRETAYTYEMGSFISIRNFCGEVGRNSNGYYVNFYDEGSKMCHCDICHKLRDEIPGFTKLATAYSANAESISDPDKFPEFESIGAFNAFIREIKGIINKSLISKSKKENESGFQKPKASVIGGFVPVGHSMCGKTSRSAIAVGHLSYGARSC